MSGDGQTAFVGDALANPLTVTITDDYGNPNIGAAVNWTPSAGTISGGTSTDGSGSASATWTLGAMPGPHSATVNAGGLTETFGATAVCFDG